MIIEVITAIFIFIIMLSFCIIIFGLCLLATLKLIEELEEKEELNKKYREHVDALNQIFSKRLENKK